MTPFDMLEVAGFAVVAAQTGWIVMLHRRLGALRSTLSSANEVVAQIDAAARRLDESSGTALASVKEKLAQLDRKGTEAASRAKDLDDAARKAQSAAERLDRVLRNGRGRIPPAGPVPREQVEPRGFSEHMMARATPAAESEEVPAELIQRILAAQMPLRGPAQATADSQA